MSSGAQTNKSASKGPASFGDYVAVALATFGVGYIKLAPGTWGSAVGVGIYLAGRELSLRIDVSAAQNHLDQAMVDALRVAIVLTALVALTLVGVWAATRAERIFAKKDPGRVVVDEVAGQLITLLCLPVKSGLAPIVAGFFLFRLFDIWKPYPIRHLEGLPSGLGIMADDVLAGAYAATVLAVFMAGWTMFAR